MDRSYFIPRRREATGITRFLTVIRPDLLLLINLLHHTGVKLASVFANTNTIRNRSSTRVLNIFCKKESVCVTIETIDIVENRNRDTGVRQKLISRHLMRLMTAWRATYLSKNCLDYYRSFE